MDAELAGMTLETAAHAVFGEPIGSLTIGVEEGGGGRNSEAALVLRAFRNYFNTPDIERGFKHLFTPILR